MLGTPYKISYTTCLLVRVIMQHQCTNTGEAWIGSAEVPLAHEAVTHLAGTNPNVSHLVTKERLSSAYQVRKSLTPNSVSSVLLFRKVHKIHTEALAVTK